MGFTPSESTEKVSLNGKVLADLLEKKTGLKFKIYVASDYTCLLYTSDAADERSSVDLGGRRIIKKKNNNNMLGRVCRRNHNKYAIGER